MVKVASFDGKWLRGTAKGEIFSAVPSHHAKNTKPHKRVKVAGVHCTKLPKQFISISYANCEANFSFLIYHVYCINKVVHHVLGGFSWLGNISDGYKRSKSGLGVQFIAEVSRLQLANQQDLKLAALTHC